MLCAIDDLTLAAAAPFVACPPNAMDAPDDSCESADMKLRDELCDRHIVCGLAEARLKSRARRR
jgi:hypothetical protein